MARRQVKPRALLAVAHSLLVSIDDRLRDHVPSQDVGPDDCDPLQPQRLERHDVRRWEAFGFPVQLTPASEPTAGVVALPTPNQTVREEERMVLWASVRLQ
jgi:hypothetical protein